jgi:hypothetical protein
MEEKKKRKKKTTPVVTLASSITQFTSVVTSAFEKTCIWDVKFTSVVTSASLKNGPIFLIVSFGPSPARLFHCTFQNSGTPKTACQLGIPGLVEGTVLIFSFYTSSFFFIAFYEYNTKKTRKIYPFLDAACFRLQHMQQ